MRREGENTATVFCVWVAYLGKFHSSWVTLATNFESGKQPLEVRWAVLPPPEVCIERIGMNR